MPSAVSSLASWVMRNRSRLPGFVRRLPEVVEENPRGTLSRAAYLLLGGDRAAPATTVAPSGKPTVIVGPMNHAGQGTQWARALERHNPGLGACALAVTVPGTVAFPSDRAVPFGVYWHSSDWQKRERDAVYAGFDHALVESMRPLFGGLFADAFQEIDALRTHGVSVALMFHGTDVRSPQRHIMSQHWSPFLDDPRRDRLQRVADANAAFASASGLPVFVSTPDLLVDVPTAQWCPVVIDPETWRRDDAPLVSRRTPVVAHIPSSVAVKGTALVEPILKSLHDKGVIVYRRLVGVPRSQMPAAVGAADIVLDQFRIGSYGVAACEAMAAGRIVVSHVSPFVREHVTSQTGQVLPIVQADPGTLDSVLRAILDDPSEALAVAATGPEFVTQVHSGARSAACLTENWIQGRSD